MIYGANIAYDFAVLGHFDPTLLPDIFKAYEEGRVYDVLIAQALKDLWYGRLKIHPTTLEPFDRYSLALVAEINLNMHLEKEDTWRLRYGELINTPLAQWPQDAIDYSKTDARVTYDVAEEQQKDPKNLHDLPAQCRAAWALHLAAVWGVRTDPSRVGEVVAEISARHDETVKNFTEAKIYRPNGSKDTKLLGALVTEAYLGHPPLTPTGKPKADRDTLKESGNDLLEAFAEAGENEKLFSTYLDMIQLGTRVPINPSIDILKATGRVSYSKPNLQQMPRKGPIRECFVPRPGRLLASVDYGTGELCALGQINLWLQGASAMATALNAKRDLHTHLAAAMVSRDYDELRAEVKAGDKIAKGLRQCAKSANFGLCGGLGAENLVWYARMSYNVRFCTAAGVAERCGVEKVIGRSGKPLCAKCLEFSHSVRQTWFETWPEMYGYFDIISAATEDPANGGQIEHFVSRRVRGGCTFTSGANSPFQGLIADAAKRAAWLVAVQCYTNPESALWRSRPVLFAHDEILAELPEETAPEAADELAAVMFAAAKEYMPEVTPSAEPALMRVWRKDAECVRDSKGRLQVWEPKAA
jgi:DNA polymerase I-like protein with 3'-5' exonuclease and polymerase domains